MKRPWYALLALPLLVLVPHGSTLPNRPHRAVLLFSASMWGGPSPDEQVDQLDASRALAAEAARLAAEQALEAARAAEAARVAALAQKATQVPQAVSRTVPAAGHSEAFWVAVALHEEGGANDPFFGYFGKIDGAWAGMSWDEQVVRANALIASYGDGAWAASSIAAGYAASPSG